MKRGVVVIVGGVAVVLALGALLVWRLRERADREQQEDDDDRPPLDEARKHIPELTEVVDLASSGLEGRVPQGWECDLEMGACHGPKGGVSWSVDVAQPTFDEASVFDAGLVQEEIAGFKGTIRHDVERKGPPSASWVFVGTRDVPHRGRTVLVIHVGGETVDAKDLAIILATRTGARGLNVDFPTGDELRQRALIRGNYKTLLDDARSAEWYSAASSLAGTDTSDGEARRKKVREVLGNDFDKVPALVARRIDDRAKTFFDAYQLLRALAVLDPTLAKTKADALDSVARQATRSSGDLEAAGNTISLAYMRRQVGVKDAFPDLIAFFEREHFDFLRSGDAIAKLTSLTSEEKIPEVGRFLDRQLEHAGPSTDWLELADIATRLSDRPAWKRHVLAKLHDKTACGSFSANDSQVEVGRRGYPSMPGTATSGSLRVCDCYALAFRARASPSLNPRDDVPTRDIAIAELIRAIAQD